MSKFLEQIKKGLESLCVKWRTSPAWDSSRGVALILVTFVVALATIIVVNLAYNTYMASRANIAAERSLQAEYILKSVLNAARVLIKEDTAPETSLKTAWGKFVGGQNVDPAILGLNVPGLHIELEINSEDAKLPIRSLISGSQGSLEAKWRYVFECMFRDLGFDNDSSEVWKQAPFQGRFFNAQQLVANLIDYMDKDSESYNEQNFEKGVEGEVKDQDGDIFRNNIIQQIDEISTIPGFTASRARKLLPYMTTYGEKKTVNLNLASRRILKCLSPEILPNEVDKIVEYRESEEGPFKVDTYSSLIRGQMVADSTWNDISSIVSVGPSSSASAYFSILSKVDYGTATYFMRAVVYRWSSGDLPEIASVEIF